MDVDINMDVVNGGLSSMDHFGNLGPADDGYFIDDGVHENSSACYYDQYEDLSDNEQSHKLLRLVCLTHFDFFISVGVFAKILRDYWWTNSFFC
jgi:hypothetical protein